MVIKSGYRIPVERLGCKFAHHWQECIGEKWMGSCPMFECEYDGDKEIPDTCDEDSKCPCYEPEETIICPKHDIEYRKKEWCDMCHPEMEEYS